MEGIETLRWEDQQKIRQYVEGGGIGSKSTPTTPDVSKCTIEPSKTSRATCKICNEKIMTGEVCTCLMNILKPNLFLVII